MARADNSTVALCNRALNLIQAREVAGLDEFESGSSQEARACALWFDHVRDTVLRSYRWNFAAARAELPASVPSPAFGYANRYPLPVDALAVRDLFDADPDERWEVEGRAILTDLAAPLRITYTRTITDLSLVDPLFADALVQSLAIRIAPKLARDRQVVREVLDLFTSTIDTAFSMDAIEHGKIRAGGPGDWETQITGLGSHL